MKRFIIILLSDPIFIFKFIYYNFLTLYYKVKGKRTIVYNLHHDYFFDIFESVYKELCKSRKIIIYFSYNKKDPQLHEYLSKHIAEKFILPNTITPFINFDLFICPEVTGPDFPISFLKTKTIEIYHGSGTYNLYEKIDVLNRFDIHFAIGNQFNEFIEFAYRDKKKKPKIYNVGYPKLDVLLSDDPLSKELSELYGLGKIPVILYAPHWNEHSSIHRFGESLIEELAEMDIKILIKPHNYLFVKYEEDNWYERLKKLEKEHKNIVIVSRSNTQELYPLADIMITDTGTTAALEFSIQKKPLFIYCVEKWFENNNHVDVERELCRTSFCYHNLDELKKEIENILNKSSSMKEKLTIQRRNQEKLIENFLYHPGNATGEAVKAILKESGI